MEKVKFGKVTSRKVDMADQDVKKVKVTFEGQTIGYLYREPMMIEWAADTDLQEWVDGEDVYGSLQECKQLLNEIVSTY